jgi:hypothetical protein
VSCFEGGWTHLPKRRVSPPLVVEHFDVIEHGHLGLAVTGKPIAELFGERGEEGFGDGVVVALALTAHAADNSVPCEHHLIVVAGVGAAPIGVVQQPRLRTAALHRHLERLQRQPAIVDGTEGPADDEPREQVHDGGQIELAALADHELRGVAETRSALRELGAADDLELKE